MDMRDFLYLLIDEVRQARLEAFARRTVMHVDDPKQLEDLNRQVRDHIESDSLKRIVEQSLDDILATVEQMFPNPTAGGGSGAVH